MIPAKVGWSDIGSWAAVYELLAAKPGANVSAGPSFTLDAEGNYFWSPKKFVAAIGVRDLVLVETEDALLLCSRDRSQDVGKIVKWLEEQQAAPALSIAPSRAPEIAIQFGTDGWRGVIAEDFTYANVRKVAHAIARYVARNEKPGARRARRLRHAVRLRAVSRAWPPRRWPPTGTPVWLAQEAVPHAGGFPAGAPARRGWRNSDHREPQSVSLERREIQGELRQLGFAGNRRADREGARARPARRRAGASPAAGI